MEKNKFCPKGHNTHKSGRTKYGGCRLCLRFYSIRWKKEHPKELLEMASIYQHQRKLDKWSIKMNPCTDCKQWYKPWQMQFDHLPYFKKGFDLRAHQTTSDKRFFKEITKCQLVCSNCHDDRTYKRIHVPDNL